MIVVACFSSDDIPILLPPRRELVQEFFGSFAGRRKNNSSGGRAVVFAVSGPVRVAENIGGGPCLSSSLVFLL